MIDHASIDVAIIARRQLILSKQNRFAKSFTLQKNVTDTRTLLDPVNVTTFPIISVCEDRGILVQYHADYAATFPVALCGMS